MDPQLGEFRWIVPGNYLLAIKVKILKIDDHFRKQHPESYLFYWVDEPIGHALDVDEFYSIDDARQELFARVKEDCQIDADLLKFREKRIRFIVSTWEDWHSANKEAEIRRMVCDYAPKIYGQDWFNVRYLLIENSKDKK